LGNARIAQSQMIPALARAQGNEFYAIASTRPIEEGLYPGVKRYASYEALLDDPDVEAVYVPLPNALHMRWSIAAMKKGKHVLCEKPIAMNEQQAEEMFAVAKAQGVLIMEAFMYRYSDKIGKIAKLVEEGAVGTIKGIHAHHGYTLTWDSPARQDPSLGGGSIYDVGCYCVSAVNLMLRLQGAQPEHVVADFKMAGQGYDERAAAILRYGNGAVGTIESWFDANGDQRMLIVGDKGIIDAPRFPSGGADVFTLINAQGKTEVACEPRDLFVEEVTHFAKAVAGEPAMIITPEETLANMRTMDMLHALRGKVVEASK
jgi:predicted dehydrogenase